jgi:hypothetical protein
MGRLRAISKGNLYKLRFLEIYRLKNVRFAAQRARNYKGTAKKTGF